MQEHYKEKYPTLIFKVIDIRKMVEKTADDVEINYTGRFDAVIDKGTLDSVMCGDGCAINADQTLSEIHRVLNSTGMYICVSSSPEEFRKKFFDKKEYDWSVEYFPVLKP